MNANNRNIFIFDWDDTLFPTSWLISKKYINNNNMVSLFELNLEDHFTLTNYSQKIAILLGKMFAYWSCNHCYKR